jgi:hypothetical protein
VKGHDGSDAPGVPVAVSALTEWLEAPMPGWARFGPVMRIEDFVVDQLTFAVGDTHRPAAPELTNY